MRAHLAELVDALVLGTSGLGRGGSSPPVGILRKMLGLIGGYVAPRSFIR